MGREKSVVLPGVVGVLGNADFGVETLGETLACAVGGLAVWLRIFFQNLGKPP